MKHKTFQMVRDEILSARKQGLSLRQISAHYPGVSFGTIGRIIEGVEPKTPDIRHALGMTVYQPAPVCPIHGVVHVGRCPREVTYKRLVDMPLDLLRWKFENRERISDGK